MSAADATIVVSSYGRIGTDLNALQNTSVSRSLYGNLEISLLTAEFHSGLRLGEYFTYVSRFIEGVERYLY